MSTFRYRGDIQVLRAIAVIAVIMFHSEVFLLRGGYLGVDIFFVISGFLVTGMILRGLDRGDFSFAGFYMRRADRLLPAALSTFLATTVIAIVLLPPRLLSDFFGQLAGALAFCANIVLMFKTGYFDGAAADKPLLHIWSLSLEEQFYFLVPMLLFLVPRKVRPVVLIGLLFLSLALCTFLMMGAPGVPSFSTTEALRKIAFFMLPSRAWELLMGSVCAWIAERYAFGVSRWMKSVSLLVICAILFHPISGLHPGIDAVIIVVATGTLLLGDSPWMPRLPAIERIGDWSYSLYLVHWPLFAFASILYMGSTPGWLRAGLVAVSFVLGWAQYRWVETPLRHGGWRMLFRKRNALILPGLAALPFIAAGAAPARIDFSQAMRPNHGLNTPCSMGSGIKGDSKCQTRADPAIAVWGDSFAMPWVVPLADADRGRLGIVQLTKHGCAPFSDLVPFPPEITESDARSCEALQRSALKDIIASSSIKRVVVSSPFLGYFNVDNARFMRDGKPITLSTGEVATALEETIHLLQAHGKIVTIIAPLPSTADDLGACEERRLSGSILAPKSCDFSEANVQVKWSRVFDALRKVGSATGVPVIWPGDAIKKADGTYRASFGRQMIFVDDEHPTYAGALEIARRLRLYELVSGKDRG